MSTTTEFQPWDRVKATERLAQGAPQCWYVSLGVGMPTTVADYVPPETEVIFDAEKEVRHRTGGSAPFVARIRNKFEWLLQKLA